MNGASALLSTLVSNDVTVCFANPGTTEMHLVAGLDDIAEMRAILCLFEGVATGAADGYARVARRPAATLLHLGPGLGNGWANLHNARRARVPLINIVGDHATHHGAYDAPLQSNIEALASALEGWYRRPLSPDEVTDSAVDALRAAYGPPGRVATLVVPSDVSWGELTTTPPRWPLAVREAPRDFDPATMQRAVARLRLANAALFLGGQLDRDQLALAQRVASATGARMILETFPASVTRGAGVASPERLNYFSQFAQAQLKDIATLVVLGTTRPVGFFAYPNVESAVVSASCEVIDLAPPGVEVTAALEALCEATAAAPLVLDAGEVPAEPEGTLNAASFAAAVAATMPEDLVVVDESNTSGLHLYAAARFAPPHELFTLTGGAIGFALPVALGAAVAAGRRVLALESDGSMLYTAQALWSMARENLDITVVALSNRSYAILTMERSFVGESSADAASQRLFDLENPRIDLAALSRSLGVPAETVETAEQLVSALKRSYAMPGPSFIEAVLPKGFN